MHIRFSVSIRIGGNLIKKYLILMLILIFPLPFFCNESSISVEEALKKFYNRTEWEKVKMEIEMTLVNRRGRERVRNFTLISKYFGKEIKMLFMFTSPLGVKGVKFLTFDKPDKEDERWLYLPSLKKVQRISGSSRNDYFMGSDFTYYDLTKRDTDNAEHKLLNKDEKSLFWIVESIPKKNYDIYGKLITTIRKDMLVPEKIEFFNRKGKLVKVMTSLKIEKVRDLWVVRKLEMKNVIKNHKTILEIKKISFDHEFKDEIFSPTRFSRTRIN